MASSSRHLARELVLQGLYALESDGGDEDEVLAGIIDDPRLSERHRTFARELFRLTVERRAWAEEQIATLAEHWDLKRIACIDRLIMCMAMVELTEMVDVPVKVVLDEAIELAKTYSTAQSSRFINGILDRFIKTSPLVGGRPPAPN